jgi:hypothetical protein
MPGSFHKNKHGGKPPIKRERGKTPTCLAAKPEEHEACHNIGNALLQSIAKIGTKSTMKSSIRTS